MKRLLFTLLSVLVLFLATAFMQSNKNQNTATETSSAVYKLMELVYLWDLLQQQYGPDRERDATWLDVGFRSKYAMSKKYASIKMIEATFEIAVFLRGPS